jgi:hypothetical protein
MVIDKARDLGIALSESSEFQHMLQVRAAIEENETLVNMINLLHEKQSMVGKLLAEGEDTDSRTDIATLSNEIEDIQRELMESQLFTEMLDAQHAFEALMQRVNRVIAACIGADFDGGACDNCMH